MQSETIRKLRLNIKQDFDFDIEIDHESKLIIKIKALLGMFARFPWGRRDMLGSMNGKYEGVSVKYASLIVSCHWIKVFITA